MQLFFVTNILPNCSWVVNKSPEDGMGAGMGGGKGASLGAGAAWGADPDLS